MGAAGRDFHNFNMVYRDDPGSRVVAFTAAQIDLIDDRIEVLEDRLDRRRGDASDADSAVMHAQLETDTGEISWHRLAAGRPVARRQCRRATCVRRMRGRPAPGAGSRRRGRH